MPRWIFNILIALDELLNSITGGAPDETVSSRSAKAMLEGKTWGCVLCKFLNLFQRDHCMKAIELDRGEKVDIKP